MSNFKRHKPKKEKLGYKSDGIKAKNAAPQQQRQVPSGVWRKKYDCKKRKGPHLFKLHVPDYIMRSYRGRGEKIDPEKLYEQHDADVEARQGTFWRSRFRQWKCVKCGKLEYDTQEKPRAKIRDNICQKK